jgi:hypothetical protein
MMMDNRGTGVVPRMNALRNYSEIAGYEVYTINPNPQVTPKHPVFSFSNNAHCQIPFCGARIGAVLVEKHAILVADQGAGDNHLSPLELKSGVYGKHKKDLGRF